MELCILWQLCVAGLLVTVVICPLFQSTQWKSSGREITKSGLHMPGRDSVLTSPVSAAKPSTPVSAPQHNTPKEVSKTRQEDQQPYRDCPTPTRTLFRWYNLLTYQTSRQAQGENLQFSALRQILCSCDSMLDMKLAYSCVSKWQVLSKHSNHVFAWLLTEMLTCTHQVFLWSSVCAPSSPPY